MQSRGSLYAELSTFYDQFCAGIDYAAQCAFAERAFLAFAESGGRDYLDLACGTGQHLRTMHLLGFNCSGLDNSAAILAQAAQRCPEANLLLCDLAAFTQDAAFDLITCFLYSIHYSHPTSALVQTLQCAWKALKPGGLFLFNAVDASGIRNDSGVHASLVHDAAVLGFRSRWHYRGAGEVLDLHLEITRDLHGNQQRWQDHHTMTAVTLPQLQDLLAAQGFAVTLFEHDHAALLPWQGQSHNVIVAACKPGGQNGSA